jgi:hypothetical protein
MLDFAQHLAAEGDHERAAAEYERYLLAADPPVDRADSLRLRIAVLLRRAGEAERSASRLVALADRRRGTALGCAATRQLAFTHWDRGQYALALDVLKGRASGGPGHDANGGEPVPTPGCENRTEIGASYLLMGRWDEAAESLALVSRAEAERHGPLIDDLRALAEEGARAPRKSAAAAVAMSSVIPGAGKVYAGRVSDGVVSFLTVSLLTWTAIDTFDREGTDSVKGWIYGGLSLWFYAGNLHGSAVAVRQHNQGLELSIMERAAGPALRLSFDI